MDNKNIIQQLVKMNSREEILHFFDKNNIDINDEKFKFFMKKFKNIKDEEEYILENVSGGGNMGNSYYINALKLTGCLFLAVGGGFALGNLYRGSKIDNRPLDLLFRVNSYWENIVKYNDENMVFPEKNHDIQKLNSVARTNMALFGRYNLNEILNNPQMYEEFMNMFSQSPEDIINYHS